MAAPLETTEALGAPSIAVMVDPESVPRLTSILTVRGRRPHWLTLLLLAVVAGGILGAVTAPIAAPIVFGAVLVGALIPWSRLLFVLAPVGCLAGAAVYVAVRQHQQHIATNIEWPAQFPLANTLAWMAVVALVAAAAVEVGRWRPWLPDALAQTPARRRRRGTGEEPAPEGEEPSEALDEPDGVGDAAPDTTEAPSDAPVPVGTAGVVASEGDAAIPEPEPNGAEPGHEEAPSDAPVSVATASAVASEGDAAIPEPKPNGAEPAHDDALEHDQPSDGAVDAAVGAVSAQPAETPEPSSEPVSLAVPEPTPPAREADPALSEQGDSEDESPLAGAPLHPVQVEERDDQLGPGA